MSSISFEDKHLDQHSDLKSAPALESAVEAGKEGHAIPTDHHGHALVAIDRAIEARIVRKIDIRVVPILFILYICAFLDRTNIGNARLAGLEADLGMAGTDYNIAASAFAVTYVVAELPSNAVTKIVGPGKMIPIMTFLFGLFAFCQAFVTNLAGLVVCRLLLGIAEAPMFPGIAFFLTRWYKKDEVATRLAFVLVSAPLAGAFGGLLAAAILNIHSIGYLTRWRMIFFIEGLATMVLAIIFYFFLTKGIDSARWLTEEEKLVANARLKAENPATRTVIEKASVKRFRAGLTNANAWGCALLFFAGSLTVGTMSFFLPTIVRGLFPTKTTVQQQLLTVPPYISAGAWELLTAYGSQRLRVRWWILAGSGLFVTAGFAMFLGSTTSAVGYAACFVAVFGLFPNGVLSNAWSAINAGTDSSRAMAIAVTVFAGNIGGLVGIWTVLPGDAPRYKNAYSVNLAMGVIQAVGPVVIYIFQRKENAKRERGERDYRLQGLSEDQVADLGHKHPEFRFKH